MFVFDECGVRGICILFFVLELGIMVKGILFCYGMIMMRVSVYCMLKGYCLVRWMRWMEDIDLWFCFFEEGFRGYNF